MNAPTTVTADRNVVATGHPHAWLTTHAGSAQCSCTAPSHVSWDGVHGARECTADHNSSHAGRSGSNAYIPKLANAFTWRRRRRRPST